MTVTALFPLPALDRTTPEAGAPAADRLLAGTPEFTTWNGYESGDGKRFAGTWRATPGAWRIVYDEWEYCEILEGESIVAHDDGRSWTLKAGDRFVIEPGFSGSWTVVATTTKQYVVVLP
ncbi:cupin domain-containing protein [Azospirillum picis]|uniref:Cupin superfamily protein n=1 Tax=Azospirillum picis TaxID=488438 RepID=A0ABU0MR85_9PROT|nr:cupin domain-containing protein [Azospirillum picis]MBP2302255.1 putative cupin superfamily protein [Azospirillum picis]MDQ0535834.1 putative cupin superfamily protein [Azospirillum picis]